NGIYKAVSLAECEVQLRVHTGSTQHIYQHKKWDSIFMLDVVSIAPHRTLSLLNGAHQDLLLGLVVRKAFPLAIKTCVPEAFEVFLSETLNFVVTDISYAGEHDPARI